eukprot:evm.model.scf_680.4 EVM.evm.TU.scf_680.4   scf_680:33178-36209(+)
MDLRCLWRLYVGPDSCGKASAQWVRGAKRSEATAQGVYMLLGQTLYGVGGVQVDDCESTWLELGRKLRVTFGGRLDWVSGASNVYEISATLVLYSSYSYYIEESTMKIYPEHYVVDVEHEPQHQGPVKNKNRKSSLIPHASLDTQTLSDFTIPAGRVSDDCSLPDNGGSFDPDTLKSGWQADDAMGEYSPAKWESKDANPSVWYT